MVVKLTSKGQMTVPKEIRRRLDLKEGDYLTVYVEEDELRLRKLQARRPLSPEDPIWTLIGAGDSGQADVSSDHDRYLAEAERARWDES